MTFEWNLTAVQLGPACLGWPCISVAELGEKNVFLRNANTLMNNIIYRENSITCF